MAKLINIKNSLQPNRQKLVVFCLFLLFIITRIYLLTGFTPKYSDGHLYGKYALENRVAKENKMSFYDLHARLVEQTIENIKKDGKEVPEELYMRRMVEYPPIAIQWLKLPAFFINKIKVTNQEEFIKYSEAYKNLYRWWSFFAELILFFVMLKMIWSLYAESSLSEKAERGVVFIFGGLFLAHLLYDRLDIILAVLILFSLGALISKKISYVWSFVIFALAINFKLIPIILVPIWVVGSLPYTYMEGKRTRKYTRNLFKSILHRMGLIFILIFAWMVPFLIWYGKPCLDFLTYHKNRGIQIESLYSSLIMTINLILGVRTEVYHAYGSFNIRASYFPNIAKFADIVLLMGLSALLILFIIKMFKLNAQISTVNNPINKGKDQKATIASKMPGLFIY